MRYAHVKTTCAIAHMLFTIYISPAGTLLAHQLGGPYLFCPYNYLRRKWLWQIHQETGYISDAGEEEEEEEKYHRGLLTVCC